MKKRGIRIIAKESEGVTTVKILIRHPMETGTRKDKKTGKLVPAHFVEEVKCTLDGKDIYTAHLGVAVSKNPYLSFKIKNAPKGRVIAANWKDNKHESGQAEVKIK